MPEYYLLIIVLLLVFAAGDLIVGVGNDAVNFLNSAIGSKVAPRHVILIIASLGVFIGAAFSGGMMEVARKGIFNPSYFVFAEVMVIFIAVMLTDIILLDVFNTLGLPTSTTVSLIFELLGASVAMGLLKTIENGESVAVIANYINYANVITIMSGIFLSVILAFTFGALVQYVSRLLFSFNYQNRLKKWGGIWSGLALSVMTYYLLIKGIKGVTFLSSDLIAQVQANTLVLFGASFLFWFALMQVLVSVFNINVLRFVVLFGTFGLAMAFAGNDLVNFIGVPMAGFEAYKSWVASGMAPQSYGMDILTKAVKPDVLFLVIAGFIMVATLWLSRKARTVTDTEVGLGRQDEGIEKFKPSALSRMMVRFTRFTGEKVQQLIPKVWLDKAESNFTQPEMPVEATNNKQPAAAFDLLRASVNLTVASALIALGTSYKLPLSTTYVTFIVAMGSSLSDRAWGRDSAVYRVSGVLQVVGGWFATAIIAFMASGFIATLIHLLGGWAIVGILILAAGLIMNNFRYHHTQETEKERIDTLLANTDVIDGATLAKETAGSIADTLLTVQNAYHLSLEGLKTESASLLNATKHNIKTLKRQNKEFELKLLHSIQRTKEANAEAARVFLLVYDLEQDLIQSIQLIIKVCREYVENQHLPLKPTQIEQLLTLQNLLDNYLELIINGFKNYNFNTLQQVSEQKEFLFETLEDMLVWQIQGVQQQQYNTRNSYLFFSVLLETKDLIAVAARFMKLYSRLHTVYEPDQRFKFLAS